MGRRPTERDYGDARAPQPSAATRTDYEGAIQGSLLAASVVTTAGTLGRFPRLELILLLLVTGLVFYVEHVYAHVIVERPPHEPLTRQDIRRVAIQHWPTGEVAVPPALAVAISPLFGLGLQGTTWFALAVALIEQVSWATIGVVRTGAPRRLVLVSGAVNLLLGAVIVTAKTVLKH